MAAPGGVTCPFASSHSYAGRQCAVFARLRRAMPTGGRRSKPSSRFISLSGTRFRSPLGSGAGVNTGGPCPGVPRGRPANRSFTALQAVVPTGGRRSKPSPRFFSLSGTRFRTPAGSGAGVNTGGPCPAEPLRGSAMRGSRPCGPWCRPEVGVPSRPRASSPSAFRPYGGSARKSPRVHQLVVTSWPPGVPPGP